MSNTEVNIELLSQYLETDNLNHVVSQDDRTIQTGFTGETGHFRVSVVLWDDERLKLLIGVRIPIIVPEKHRVAVAELITRANFGMAMGGFEMDMSTGYLGFKVTMSIVDGTITEEQFRTMLNGAMGTVDAYFSAFGRLIYGDDLSPAEAVAEIEMAE